MASGFSSETAAWHARRFPWRSVLSALAVVLLAGCSVQPGTTAGGSPDASAGRSGARGSSAGEAVPHDLDMAVPSPPLPPTADDTSGAAALDVATRAVAAFARPGLDADTWWTELAPMLSPAAQAAYVGTDPAEIPVTGVSGEPHVVDDVSSPYLATVAVPTDSGVYAVLLSRTGAGAPWLIERLDPPATDPATLPRSPIDAPSTGPAA